MSSVKRTRKAGPFALFVKAHHKDLKVSGVPQKNIMKALAVKWRSLTPTQKMKYGRVSTTRRVSTVKRRVSRKPRVSLVRKKKVSRRTSPAKRRVSRKVSRKPRKKVPSGMILNKSSGRVVSRSSPAGKRVIRARKAAATRRRISKK